MDANLIRQQQQQLQMSSGLMRYRSAPSSLIATLMDGDGDGGDGDGDGEGCDDFIPTQHHHHNPPPSSSPEAETMFARFMTDSATPDLQEIENKFPPTSRQFINTTIENKYSPPSQIMYHQNPPQPSMSLNPIPPQMGSSNLIRHSSSPAGLFTNLSVENGYAVMRGIGNSRVGNGGSNGDVGASASRLKGQINFSSARPSSSEIMSQISDSAEGASLGNGTNTNRYLPNFPIASWDDSTLENFTGLKRFRDVNGKMVAGLNSSEGQNGEAENRAPGLTHHYSLPKNSAEMAAILQFQDSVPCKIRAKRGCATHPRSIAERVRRTRISERMRKLQELVPNMDKQTNTADMLDLAVEYIKDLQKQVKMLNDNGAKCTCSSKQKPYQNSRV